MILWQSSGKSAPVSVPFETLDRLAEHLLSGYQRYSWGGVEVGGVLFGKKEPDGVYVYSFRPIDCEHEYGPSFDLSVKDLEALGRTLPTFATELDLSGLEPVGWYYSVSRREPTLDAGDQVFHDRFFPQQWQIAMILKRAKTDPLEIGLFSRDSSGTLQQHSTRREFRIENFRLHPDEAPSPQPAPEPLPEPAPEIHPIVQQPIQSNGKSDVLVPIESAWDIRAPRPIDEVHHQPKPPLAPEPIHEPALELVTTFHAPEPENPYATLHLTGDPFCPTPDPRFFDPTPQHREALANLLYGIQSRKGFLGLIGEAGTGKSIVLECVMEQLREQKIAFAFLFNSKINSEQFFELFAIDLNLRYRNPTKTSVLIALNEYLTDRSQDGQTTVLIVDNAQKLRPDVLEEIELLGNLENRRGPLMQVVFAAQPNFEKHLEKPELRGLRQRLLCRARLGPLNAPQTASYIVNRLAKCGVERQTIFPPDLLVEIYNRTQGIPRLINAVCWNLLTLCAEDKRSSADMPMLDRVSAELELDRQNDDPSQSAAVFA